MKYLAILAIASAALVYCVWATTGVPTHCNAPLEVRDFMKGCRSLLVCKCEYDTCGACKRLAPCIYYLADKYPEFQFIIANMSSCWMAVECIHVNRTPTVGFLAYDEVIGSMQTTNCTLLEAYLLKMNDTFNQIPPPPVTEPPAYVDYYYDIWGGGY